MLAYDYCYGTFKLEYVKRFAISKRPSVVFWISIQRDRKRAMGYRVEGSLVILNLLNQPLDRRFQLRRPSAPKVSSFRFSRRWRNTPKNKSEDLPVGTLRILGI